MYPDGFVRSTLSIVGCFHFKKAKAKQLALSCQASSKDDRTVDVKHPLPSSALELTLYKLSNLFIQKIYFAALS